MRFQFFFIFTILFFIGEKTFSQESLSKCPVVYLEVAGAGFDTYNVNAEHLIFSKSSWYANGRVGFGYLADNNSRDYQIPIGVNVFHGNRNSHPELGLYLTYTSRHYDNSYVTNM